MNAETNTPENATTARVVKVLIWDLDETLWHGILVEGDELRLREGVRETLEELDRRGILQSVASKNDPEQAMAALKSFGIDHYFLYPQIGWSAKSVGVRKIHESINVGLDALAFMDDQPFERDEVARALPEVLVLEESALSALLERPEFMPRFITDESAIRRGMYQADIERNQAQEEFEGPDEEFLASLKMRFTIAPASEEDLRRAEELTVRTNQLNSTGVTYSYAELDAFRRSDDHLLLVAALEDRYGTYGKIGLALVDHGTQSEGYWTLKLLLMSCRVMSRGVGGVLLGYVMRRAREAGARLRAELIVTGRNRLMTVTYRFAGFQEIERRGEVRILEHPLTEPGAAWPDYVDVRLPSSLGKI